MVRVKQEYEYLKSILSNKDIERLENAIREGRTIIVDGPQGPTGKSRFVRYLKERGVNATEYWEAEVFTLDKPLKNRN
ncbi:hypothetical protein LAE98_07195 [Bacillus wiedmannii]|uniref:hypothetical protein n=1 Tax=Bacillus wiedmannii TaxID=1890302 RepID=UPI001CBA6D44|nr:hypothetical protein [Bacillus wiedmannii]MBZ4221904.1 hypothetical protein [Bacillus wiedmannii]